jgi:hypothetical protein
MFGRGRFQNGVLIDPKPQFAFDPKDQAKLEAFRKSIWQVSVSVYMSLNSHCEIQANRGTAKQLRTTTLPLVQGGSFVHPIPSTTLLANQDNCPDDNCGVSIKAVCIYSEDDGAQASNPQGL